MKLNSSICGIYFISDTHFYHNNVISYSNRPFVSVEEMNNKILFNINNKVKKNDYLFILGDFSFGKTEQTENILNLIVCENVHLVSGNHDLNILRNENLISKFKSVVNYSEITIRDESLINKNQRIILFHYPILEWNQGHRGSWMLHGHCHNNLKLPQELLNKKIKDVGCDAINFTPISYFEIKDSFNDKENITHHNE